MSTDPRKPGLGAMRDVTARPTGPRTARIREKEIEADREIRLEAIRDRDRERNDRNALVRYVFLGITGLVGLVVAAVVITVAIYAGVPGLWVGLASLILSAAVIVAIVYGRSFRGNPLKGEVEIGIPPAPAPSVPSASTASEDSTG